MQSMKSRVSLAVCVLILVLSQSSWAGAATRWTLNGVTFSDGGTAEGYFDFDADAGTVADWRVSVSGGNTDLFPELIYSPENSTENRFSFGDPQKVITFSLMDSNRAVRITPDSPLTNSGGTVQLLIGSNSGNLECFNCAPSREMTAGELVAGPADNSLLFPQFGDGGGLQSELVLTNTTASEATCRAEFRDGDGNALAISLSQVPPGTQTPAGPVTTVDFTMPPYATVTIATPGISGSIAVGSVVVLSDRLVGGIVRFTIAGAGIAGVGSSPPLAQFVVPVRRTANIINSGLSIRNAESSTVQLQLTLVDAGGTTAPNGTRTISDFPPSGQLSKFIDELFPDALTDDFEGSVRVEVTGGKVSAVALELGTAPGEFTTLPVISLAGQ